MSEIQEAPEHQTSGDTYVPGRCAVVALGHIMEAFSMTTHDQDLVLNVLWRVLIQALDVVLESFPLRFLRTALAVCLISAIDQA